jgi:hypothetical protein
MEINPHLARLVPKPIIIGRNPDAPFWRTDAYDYIYKEQLCECTKCGQKFEWTHAAFIFCKPCGTFTDYVLCN